MVFELFEEHISAVTSPLPGSVAGRVTYRLSVKKRYEGMVLIDFLLQAIPRSTPQLWLDKIAENELTINGNVANPLYLVKAGEIVVHQSSPKTEPPINVGIQLIYEDEAIIVLNKPSPLPVHASGRFVRNTLIAILELAFPKTTFKLLHRIDANTTGIIVLAKDKLSAHFIQQQFEHKTIKKTYLALVEGVVSSNEMNLQQAIGTTVLAGGSRKIDDNGKVAETQVKVLERYENSTLLEVKPLTGRTNQIRLHLAQLGHPIVGDAGHKDPTYFKHNPFTYNTDSLFLHAYQLQLKHPTTKTLMTFVAPVPEKFRVVFRK